MRVSKSTADIIIIGSLVAGIYAGCIIGYVLGTYL
jgi:uncharacterized membrane protein